MSFPIKNKKDIYDVDSYSENELYEILDLMNPSDRELEAKIHHMIWKYTNFNNESGNKLAVFFQNIYDRFFDGKDDEDDDDEGYENMTNMESVPVPVPVQAPASTPTSERNYVYSIPTEISKDNLNPLLKQTTKRIINIDSQYREDKSVPPTNYTFNLSSPLKDVVSLKLYSYNIPYTWYTISKSYGSNFFILRGNSPGIDNGKYDFKIEIGIGNYLVPDLINTVNTALKNLRNDVNNSDISFGFTGITYGVNSTLSTFVFDIQKLYNESYYEMYFANWSTPNTETVNRTTIPAFLGFNFGSPNTPYLPNIVYSLPDLPYTYGTYTNGTSIIPYEDVTNNIYTLDSSNNYFNIIQYTNTTSNNGYNVNTSHMIQNIQITMPTDTNYSKYTLFEAINTQLKNNIYINSTSQINRIDISNSVAIVGNGYSQYQMNIQLNRFTTTNVPNSKIVVVFPNDNIIWISSTSIFHFSKTNNELSTIISETSAIQTNYLITTTPTIEFNCKNIYYTTNPKNSYVAIIPPSPSNGYLLSNYLSQINTSITLINTNNKNISNPNGIFNMATTTETIDADTSLFTFNIDLTKKFTNYDYYLDISNSFLGTFNLFETITDPSYNIDLSTNTVDYVYTFTGSRSYSGGNYTWENNILMVLKPKETSDNFTAPYLYVNIPDNVPNTLYLTGYNIDHSNDLTQVLNNIFITYGDPSDGNDSKVLSSSSISFIINGENIDTTLQLKITKTLTQKDYELKFNDLSFNLTPINWKTSSLNSWYINLGLEKQTYVLSDPSYNTGINVSYSTVSGKNQISNIDYINITNQNNKIYIQPRTSSVGVYTGDDSNIIILTVPIGIYTRDQLITQLNTQFSVAITPNGQTIASGSLFSIFMDETTKNNYTSLTLNINKIYSASDYVVNFYDPYSYASCFSIGKSIQNTTWDSTMGWILGFHNYTEYPLASAIESTSPFSLSGTYINPNTKIVTLTGDTSVSTYIYGSFMIILDDYNQNHMNDGLVTTTHRDTSIPLPSYASRATLRCDPSNKQSIVSINNNDHPSTGDDTNPQRLLTNKQFLSAQSILNAKNGVSTQVYSMANSLSNLKTNEKYYSNGPFAKDVFAIIPLKIAGQPQNTPYVDFSGTLQNQERMYFGPVNIHRMTVKLKNDRGELVDLNNANWSFSLICEQLYQQRKI
jgi:hypothetical protein